LEKGIRPILQAPVFSVIWTLVLLLGAGYSLHGQEQPRDSTQQDSVKTGYDLGRIQLPNPESVVSKYSYDPLLDRYVYTEKVGDYSVNYPLYLTPEQFYELMRREAIKGYFKEKIDAYSGKKEGSEEARKNLLPNFYVNSGFFESIFGGNTIEVIPQGSVAMDLGILWQKNDNPALSPRNRSNLSLDFDQRISLSLLGKVGERLQVNAQYDTEATFDFQNLIKLEYTPTEDDILQNIEIGNVSMPLSGSLISGAQSLFGVKTELQFGRTRITAVFSEQQSQNNSVVAQGGGTVNDFQLSALDYDEDRHFFLAQYFRDQYDRALASYPFIQSQVQITRLEVWVTNRSQQTLNVRNIVAIQDLGETEDDKTRLGRVGTVPPGFFNTEAGSGLPQNGANDYDPGRIGADGVLTAGVRDIATVENAFNVPGYTANQGFDYTFLENAQKLEQGRDYTFDSQLGFISLNQRLSNDEVLAVAFQYTFNGQVYQVGEFANGSIDATSVSPGAESPVVENNTLILKLLKSNITNVEDPIWDLMMKNIYSTGAFQLSEEDFRLNILYTDPSPRNYITPVDPNTGWPEGLEDRILINVFNFDRLNIYNDVQDGGDGFFDFIPGITVDTQSGRIRFTKVEPFGEFLFEVMRSSAAETYDVDGDQGYNPNQEKYVFRNLYAKTKAASLQDAEKNRFQIKGRYKSQGQSGIPIGAFNVPRGSVRVTAGGRQLQEGIDYTVNYQGGTVQLLDPSLEASNVPINISVENNAVFGQQTRRFSGVNVEHTFNENFRIGGTLINLNERPLTQKANFGVEPVNNTVFGLNGIFSTELPFLTRLANKLPNIDTDVPSNLSLRGEIAFLSPNSPKNADLNGETTSYLDDFEGAQALIDIRGFLGWTLASPPLEFFPGDQLPGTTPEDPLNLTSGYGRAKMAWYTIDPIFYTNQRPAGLSDNDLSLNETRRVFIDEVFPTVDIAQGQTTVQGTLDLAYYPENKGPYNNNPAFDGLAPDQKWAGIMRPLSSTNFEQSNVEFVQFWVLDPYVDGIATDAGELVINLGNISEDILKDGRKQYENGLPATDGDVLVSPTSWGQVPSSQSLVYAFDANEANRSLQDLGFDGLPDSDEANFYNNNPGADPALDNYQYYLNRDGSVLERYLDFNNPQGNSPVGVTNTNRGSTTLPDVEDIDRDLTMNTVNSYYEYRIPIQPGTTIDDRYVTDIREGLTPTLPNGQQLNRRWIQYKIPLSDFTDAVGGISDFRSISFMRMYLTGFDSDIVLRFATLDLVRGDWRAYLNSLQTDKDDPSDDLTEVDVNTVNIEENSGRIPIPYVLPPGVVREQLNNNNTIVRQNEQSLSFLVEGLEPLDSRGVFKNLNIDVRQYERIRMFMHAEEIVQGDYGAGDTPLIGFLRIGTDFSQNYYQIEVPLEFTPFSARSPDEIWPSGNEMNIALDQLNLIKSRGIERGTLSELTFYEFVDGQIIEVMEDTPYTPGRQRIAIKGNPSLGSLRAMMVGVKNADNLPARGEVWFNELRLAGLDNQGGWAATAALDANMADFMNVTATLNASTSGFGSIDQIPNERAREDSRTYDIVTNVNVGQVLPKKWGLQIPFNYGFSETLITPEFDPVFEDLKLDDRISQSATPEDAERVRQQAEDYTKRRSLNLIGVRKERAPEARANFFDIENFTFNYSYNETNHRDFEVAELRDQRINAGVVYAHEFQPVTVEPFARNDSILRSSYWQWLKELNFNLLPSSISMNADVNRTFNQQRFRDVFEPGVDALELPTLQQRNYLFNWQYAVNYNITKSLRANLTASNNAIVRNYFNVEGDEGSGVNPDLEIWDGFFDVGQPNRHSQQLQLNYELPLDKFPFLNFMTAQYTYNSNFDWQRGGDALREIAGEDINTVQNASTHNITANLSMQGLYDFIGLVKRDGTEPARTRVVRNAEGEEEEIQVKPKKTSKAHNVMVDVLTMVKRATVNYSENRGTVLPGYTRSVGFIGTTKPSLGFVFGSQADVRFDAARRGYLTTFPEFNSQFMQNLSRQLSITATAQPTPEITIDLTAERQFSRNVVENFRVEQLADNTFEYNQLLTNSSGNFSISNIMIATAFRQSDEFVSETFEDFKENRLIIANRLLEERPELDTGNRDTDGFPERFGKTQQEVLLPAFIAAYTGQSADQVNLSAFRDIPLPNWNIKWTGLMKNKWFQKNFRRFSIQHGYRSAYSINSFQTNLEKQNGLFEPESGDVRPDDIISNIVLNDQFNPLIRLDFEMENSLSVLAEIRTDRALSLSFDNNLLTEVNGREYTLGLGYRIKDVRLVTTIAGEQTRLKGDLNMKADISLRDNETIIRNLDLNNNQITAGQQLWGIKFTADYALSQSLNALFFYDHSFSQFKVSTAFPQTSINAGFTLRYNFGN